MQRLQRDAETLRGELGAARELLQELREQLQQEEEQHRQQQQQLEERHRQELVEGAAHHRPATRAATGAAAAGGGGPGEVQARVAYLETLILQQGERGGGGHMRVWL